MESSVRHPSPPKTYFYAQKENLDSLRNFVENDLLLTCIVKKQAK